MYSCITDYATKYELLQFQYDLWLFHTVSGAISTSSHLGCSPARSLDCKAFTTEFWRWQHRFLLDALRQFGFPSLFITISPYEWTFPFPIWLDRLREDIGAGPTNLAAYETIHIAHVLEQLVRAYLCGTTQDKWKKHIFNAQGQNNISTFFYRVEFQNRGTLHIHVLV